VSIRILVIDDEESIRDSIQLYFAHHGYAVDTAGSVREATEHLVGMPYDVVITDLRLTQLPGYGGLEILRIVKDNAPRTMTILLTAYGSEEVERQARELGVDQVIAKPLPLSELADVVFTLLQRREQRSLGS